LINIGVFLLLSGSSAVFAFHAVERTPRDTLLKVALAGSEVLLLLGLLFRLLYASASYSLDFWSVLILIPGQELRFAPTVVLLLFLTARLVKECREKGLWEKVRPQGFPEIVHIFLFIHVGLYLAFCIYILYGDPDNFLHVWTSMLLLGHCLVANFDA
jgi:hypothetical protein